MKRLDEPSFPRLYRIFLRNIILEEILTLRQILSLPTRQTCRVVQRCIVPDLSSMRNVLPVPITNR
ncbi:hypothetical protein LptCag_1671 [Leptospirillum ferriphilum]|uniref:Uncharacterized protein n=1 Tax=Leptospirillum ferriphilum TaxID=178606 RepID=A0A094WAZ6_9BACT|nr:hypothetical protein LptCag_1671 [Leptospirillum ferriphilum]